MLCSDRGQESRPARTACAWPFLPQPHTPQPLSRVPVCARGCKGPLMWYCSSSRSVFTWLLNRGFMRLPTAAITAMRYSCSRNVCVSVSSANARTFSIRTTSNGCVLFSKRRLPYEPITPHDVLQLCGVGESCPNTIVLTIILTDVI